MQKKTKKSAAVLIPIVRGTHNPYIILTQRQNTLKEHAGQICFPGGKLQADESLQECALREFKEETGIQLPVNIIGHLPCEQTSTDYTVYPYIGIIKANTIDIAPNIDEVETLITLPLAAAINKHRYERNQREDCTTIQHHYCLEHKEYFIWGITATFLYKLAQSDLYTYINQHLNG